MAARAVAVLCAVAAVAGVVVIAAGTRRSDPKPQPSLAELHRLQDRINESWFDGDLDRQGIYLISTGRPADPCVSVTLVNPTPANRQFLRRTFGPDICVRRKPSSGRPIACAGYQAPPVKSGAIRVPNLRGLDVAAAGRAITQRRLTYSLGCLGDRLRRPKPPSRYSPESLTRVVAQCPRAGERVRGETEVAFLARARLPGGYTFTHGTLTAYHTYPGLPCADGRTP